MKSVQDVLGRMPTPRHGRAVAAKAEPVCPICEGAGYLRLDVEIDDPRFGEMVACECTQRENAARRMRRLLERSNLGPLRVKRFDNFVARRDGRPAKNSPEAAEKAARQFAARPDRSDLERVEDMKREWLILAGNHGSGKTHLALAIANYRLDQGREAIFIVVPDLLDRLRATFSPNSEVTYDELFESARETELLVLDDLGAQSTTAWAQEKLYQIINERYNRRLPTVITSNLRLDDMEMRLRSRIGDTTLAENYWIQAPDQRLGLEHAGPAEAQPPPRSRSRG
jgi:DNA replication protein DnaC